MTKNIKIPYGSHEICFDIPSENVIIGAPKYFRRRFWVIYKCK